MLLGCIVHVWQGFLLVNWPSRLTKRPQFLFVVSLRQQHQFIGSHQADCYTCTLSTLLWRCLFHSLAFYWEVVDHGTSAYCVKVAKGMVRKGCTVTLCTKSFTPAVYFNVYIAITLSYKVIRKNNFLYHVGWMG